MRVLHVSECFAGGVATAVQNYARNTPSYEHVLLACARRARAGMEQPEANLFKAIQPLSTHHVQAINNVRAAVRQYSPDLIHAHSSFAGAYARLAKLTPVDFATPVVYTPHGLSTSAGAKALPAKILFGLAEGLLSPLTSVFAGCSTNEAAELKRINPFIPNIMVPNALASSASSPVRRKQETSTVAMIGRIVPGKQPELFAEIAKLMNGKRPDLKFVWIGAGEPELTNVLRKADVEVTGWLSSEEATQKLAEVGYVVYTTRAEGFPMSILEAVQLNIPTICSDIPALRDMPAQARFRNAEEATQLLTDLLDSSSTTHCSREILKIYNPSRQSSQLETAYNTAVTQSHHACASRRG